MSIMFQGRIQMLNSIQKPTSAACSGTPNNSHVKMTSYQQMAVFVFHIQWESTFRSDSEVNPVHCRT